MSICVISACKSAIVSLHTCTIGHSEFTCVESSACVGCPHLIIKESSHAVSGCKVTMNKLLLSKILHSLGDLVT